MQIIDNELKPLNYNNVYNNLIPENKIKISPSMISQFFTDKALWYHKTILQDTENYPNYFTALGTAIHRIAEQFIKTSEIDYQEVYDYLDAIEIYDTTNPSDINPISEEEKARLRIQIKPMSEALLGHMQYYGSPTISEMTLVEQISANVYLAGTVDAILGNTLIDFKTTSAKTPKTYIPDNYKWQLLTYAWLCRKNNIDIQKVAILWITQADVNRVSEKTGKKLKDYPATCMMIEHIVTEQDMAIIEKALKLIKQTVELSLKQPQLTPLLFSDYESIQEREIIDNDKIRELIYNAAENCSLEIEIFNTPPDYTQKACDINLNSVDFCEEILYQSEIDLLNQLINTQIPSDMELITAISQQSDKAKTLSLDEIIKELNYIKNQFNAFKNELTKIKAEISHS